MRTTLDFDDALLKEAKKRAAEEGKTLTRFIEEAIRERLRPSARPTKRFKLNLLVKKAGPIPGVDISDRDALYRWLEDER